MSRIIDNYGAHMAHCDEGEYEGRCKYGQDDVCPALPRVRDGNPEGENPKGSSAEGMTARCHEVADALLSSSKARIEELEAENGKMDVVIAQQCQRADKWKSRAEAAESRLSEMETALKDERKKLVAAWEALPGGQHGPRAVEAWLFNYMKPVIDVARSALRSKGETGDAA